MPPQPGLRTQPHDAYLRHNIQLRPNQAALVRQVQARYALSFSFAIAEILDLGLRAVFEEGHGLFERPGELPTGAVPPEIQPVRNGGQSRAAARLAARSNG